MRQGASKCVHSNKMVLSFRFGLVSSRCFTQAQIRLYSPSIHPPLSCSPAAQVMLLLLRHYAVSLTVTGRPTMLTSLTLDDTDQGASSGYHRAYKTEGHYKYRPCYVWTIPHITSVVSMLYSFLSIIRCAALLTVRSHYSYFKE